MRESESVRTKITRCLPLVVALSIILPVSSFAGFFGAHQHYAHALSDLHYARALVTWKDHTTAHTNELNAIYELDRSIGKVKQAGGKEWKPLAEQPRVDPHMSKSRRFHEALRALACAHNDICKEEDDSTTPGFRDQAVSDLDEAMNAIRLTMNDKHFKGG
jgi:hypothetical protein